MVTRPLYGRTSIGGGTLHQGQQGSRTAKGNAPVAYPLAQTPPRMLDGRPRFRPAKVSPIPQPYQAPNQSPQWRGGDNSNDGLIFRDRHGYMQQGHERAGRISSMPDPPSDGSIRPTFKLTNRTWNWQVGTGSAYADDLTRPYTGLGEQGSGWSTVYGGAPGFYRQGPGGLPIGDPGAGPARVWAGPPHGLHTQYPPDRQQTLTNYRARPQMVAPRVDRLSNSRIAGQTYSQWTQHQGGGRGGRR
jgi:hypothetical protein